MASYNAYLINTDTGKSVFFDKKPDLSKGELFISVSQILSMLGGGDFLIKWALREFGGFANSVQAYENYMDKVSSLGSRLHKYVEYDLKGLELPSSDLTEDMLPGINSWHEFKKEHEIELIDAELVLHSKKYRFAGQMDVRLKIDGKSYVADLKTGSVQAKAFIQLTAYKHCLKEMDLSDGSEGLLVLGGADSKSKIADGGAVQMHTLSSFFSGDVTEEDMFVKLMCLRQLWYQENIRSRKWEPIIKQMDDFIEPLIQEFKDSFRSLEKQVKTNKRKKGK